ECEEVRRRRLPHPLRADHRPAQGQHRQEDVAERGAARLRGLGVKSTVDSRQSTVSLRDKLAERTRMLCDVRSPVGEEAIIAGVIAAEAGAAWAGEVERIGNAVVLGRA